MTGDLPSLTAETKRELHSRVKRILVRYPRSIFFSLGLVAVLVLFLLPVRILPMWIIDPQALAFIALLALARWKFGPWIRVWPFVCGIVTVYSAFAAWVFVWPVAEDHWNRRDFNAVEWRESTPLLAEQWPARLVMVDDLLATRDLVGMAREAVVEMLGPPDDTNYHRSWDMVYRLGWERGLFRIDSEWLVMKLDDDRRVSAVEIVRD